MNKKLGAMVLFGVAAAVGLIWYFGQSLAQSAGSNSLQQQVTAPAISGINYLSATVPAYQPTSLYQKVMGGISDVYGIGDAIQSMFGYGPSSSGSGGSTGVSSDPMLVG